MNAYKQHLFQSKVTWKTNFNSISNYQPQSLINLIGVSSAFYTDVGKKFENYIKKSRNNCGTISLALALGEAKLQLLQKLNAIML